MGSIAGRTKMMDLIRRQVVLGIVAMFFATSTIAAGETLKVADLLDLEKVTGAQISPDGSQVLYTRRWVDQSVDRWASAIWIMDADGSRQRYLEKGGNARWSPTGDRILFIANGDNDKPQIFVRWMTNEGSTSQVTRIEMKPVSPTWAPDGHSIAFVAVVPEKDDWKIELPEKPEGATWTQAPRILDDLYYRQEKVGYMEPGFSHLFIVPASAGKARQLTEGSWNVGARRSPNGLFDGANLSWSPDSKSILFDGYGAGGDGGLVTDYRLSHIYRLDVESRELQQLTKTDGLWREPLVSPDGKRVVYEGHPASGMTYELNRLYVMNVDGSGSKLLSEEFDRPTTGEKWWAADNKQVYLSALQDGYVNVFRIDNRGRVNAVTEGKQVAGLDSVTGNTTRGVGIISSYYEPGDVYSIDLSGKKEPIRLTDVNADLLVGKTLGHHEEIWFEAEDGNRAHGWIIQPPNFDPEKTYPLLMEIHGGPFGMYQGRFVFDYQVFAANGFVVLYTNPRGSTGYGEEFSQAIDHAYPSVDYLDLMGAVDDTLAKGYIDEKRLYVGGCSGGGVLTSWVIGHTNRFAAASVRCPVTNWLSMFGQTDIPNFTQSFFQKPFWEDPSDWLHHSPIMYVGNVTTPTIVMTGEQDLRTPMAQSEEYYAALKIAGVPSRLLRFNDQFHGTSTHPSNAMRSMLYLMSWYNRYNLDGEVKTGSPGKSSEE